MGRSVEIRKQADRKYRARNIETIRAKRPKIIETFERRHPLHYLLQKAKPNARARGFEFSITVDDVVWPTHCPVLGIELCYVREQKRLQPNRSNYPSLDRWDNSQGYVPGNVFVISCLANQTKSRLSVAEMEAVVRYMKTKPSLNDVGTVEPKLLYPDQEPYEHKNTPEAVRAKARALGWECVEMDPPGKQGAIRGRVSIYCAKHDYTGNPFVEKLMYQDQGCRLCGRDSMLLANRKSRSPRKHTPDVIKARVEKSGWECVEINQPNRRVTIHCPKHNYTGTPNIDKLMGEGQGCRRCGYERTSVKQTINSRITRWTQTDA